MAVAGSLVAWAIYRLLGGGEGASHKRKVFAAGLAGYVAINLAALLTAIEFGVQPMLFHDTSGAPLYAPYPLDIAIPAMMIGHLTIAGLAEMFITGGLVAYLQRANPELLRKSVLRAEQRGTASAWSETRRLWYGLASLMIFSPLGLLAAGTAWGEWSAEDFASASTRLDILKASGNVAPPEAIPQGLAKLSSLWMAPIPDYAPAFMRSADFGYVLSALFGVGLILLVLLLISGFAARRSSIR